MLRNDNGAAASEYALILGLLGVFMLAGSLALGSAVKGAGAITAYGVNGTAYVCTNNCGMEDKDYCAAIMHRSTATFSPALPAVAACNSAGTPIS